jgi:hypothetical protein
MRPLAPNWAVSATQALEFASSRIRMIACTTPLNLRAELERIGRLWSNGLWEAPRFVYNAPVSHDALVSALFGLASTLLREGPLGGVYAERAHELAAEATICSTVGTPEFFAAARRRFSRRDMFDEQADALALRWLEIPPSESDEERIRSDDEFDPRSLLMRMREEIGARKLPFRVVVTFELSALAATGEWVVQVVGGRSLTRADVERTVLHEIEGHVLPRCRAAQQRLGIFVVGTRFGVDDQEGRALWLESGAGVLTFGRRRELGSRHLAARMLESGADFVEAGKALVARDVDPRDALRVVSRVYRGSGLGREIVYLPGYLRISRAMSEDPSLDSVLSAGRVSLNDAEVLRPWVNDEAAELTGAGGDIL